MRPVLQNQPQIGGIGQALLDSLRNLVAAISTGWNKQHNGDGGHTAVTAESATVSGLTTLGRIALVQVEIVEPTLVGTSINDLYVTGLENASCIRVVPAAAGFPCTITGINADGRQPGEMLLLVNAATVDTGGATIVLRHDLTTSREANRFAAVSGSAASYQITSGRGVWLCYNYLWDSIDTKGRVPRWIVVGETEA